MTLVKLPQGLLRGEELKTVVGNEKFYSFKGIPYAEPPIGPLRFKAPRPPLPWAGIRQAFEHGPKCPHNDIFTGNYVEGNEDCLYLNVYTPDTNPAEPFAVMFFIHGGGYKSGSGNEEFYGPDFLVRHNVVLVTINYRLEALGFLCMNTKEVPGNAGMKDQVAALRWVKSNISHFGGNPDNITVFGESAGGASTALHALSPMSKGLFRRAIPMSGVPLCDWAVPFEAHKRAYILGNQLGCDTKDPDVLLDFLQKVPVEKLINTDPTVLSYEDRNNNIMKMFHFTPVTEKDFGQEYFMIESPLEALKNGHVNDVDVFIGHTSEEALDGLEMFEKYLLKDYNRYPDLIVPRTVQFKCTPEKVLALSERIRDYYFNGKPISLDTMREFVTYGNHTSFLYDIHKFISHLPKVGQSKRYLYKFSCVSDRNVYGKPGLKYGIRGAAHMDDLMYLFDAKHFKDLKLKENSKEYELIQLVCKVFTNFAKYGNPTPEASLGVIWPEYDSTIRPYVDIADKLIPGVNSDAEAMEFWDNIHAYAEAK